MASSTEAQQPVSAPRPGVSRSRTLIACLPTALRNVVTRSEFNKALLKVVRMNYVKCVQSMPNGVFRLTFTAPGPRDHVMSEGIVCRQMQCIIFKADPQYTVVKIFRCPFEVSSDTVKVALSAFGKVHLIKGEVDHEFPSIFTGTLIAHMTIESPIPSRIKILRYPCNVWYVGQPKTCRVCQGKDHEAPHCPLKGKCLRCRQEGHSARDCPNPWGRPYEKPPDTNDPPEANGPPEANAPDGTPPGDDPPAAVATPIADPVPPVETASQVSPDTQMEVDVSVVPDSESSESLRPLSSASEADTDTTQSVDPSVVSQSLLDNGQVLPDNSDVFRTPASPSAPLVDKEGFILVQSRRSRQRSSKAPVIAEGARSRSRSNSRQKIVSPGHSRHASPAHS